ncbi:MAG: hypothetical protein V4635_17850 [Bacteroidota bacterium]
MEKTEKINRTVTTSVCQISVEKNDVVFVKMNENAIIDIEEVDEMHQSLNELVDHRPYYMVVIPAIGNTSSSEARKYAARLKNKKLMAEAIVVDNLAQRIMANFYVKVNRPNQKVKVFSSVPAGLAWIDSVRIKSLGQVRSEQ